MAELTVEVPEDVIGGIEQLPKKEVNTLVVQALRERLSERLMFRVADELLKNSKVTDKLAMKWGSELKERALAKGW